MEAPDFEPWYRKERPRLFRAVWAMAGDRDLAAEIVDEAFSRAFERWDRVGGMDSPSSWVRVVALNHLRRTMRRKGIETRLFGRHRAAAETIDALPDPHLWDAVRALPSRQREVIALRYVLD